MDDSGSNVGEGRQQVTLGDVIFVKPRGGSWWPAVVVDKITAPKSARSGGRSAAEKVRVRLYGSSQCLYVDPVKSRSEFEKVLKQHNGSQREIFEQSLEMALPSSKLNKSKRSGSQTKGKKKVKRLKQSNVQCNVAQNVEDSSDQIEETGSEGMSQELSERRARVMNKLGLTPPPGSPFTKD